MRSLTLTALCMGLLGLGGFPPPAAAQPLEFVSNGSFQDIGPRYQGTGTVNMVVAQGGIVELQFQDDFAVPPGPDLEGWLIDGTTPTSSGDVLVQEYLSLGPLQSFTGLQSYELPSGVIGQDYDAVIIWCEDFGVLFSAAALVQPGG